MRYLAVACDYDGTVAKDGTVDPETIASLERTKASGRSLILATGRELEDLAQVFPAVGLFDRVVGENGAIVHDPRAGTTKRLAEPPPPRFIQMLRDRGVTPLSVGHVIVATRQPNETVVLQLIRDLGLELQVIFNKGAVMVLPSSINKGLGVIAALEEMGLSPHNCVGVGDAENDHAFLSICECSVAVANALPGIKECADFVTQRTHGAGVRELLDLVITQDLRSLEASLTRHDLVLGTRTDGAPVLLKAYGSTGLVLGPSASGRSIAVIAILEQLIDLGYQFCLVDPEGDHESLEGAVRLGNRERAPSVDEVLQLLGKVDKQVALNLTALPFDSRADYFFTLHSRLLELRVKTGRPHWIVVDEARQVFPRGRDSTRASRPTELMSMIFATVDPEQIDRDVLTATDTVIAVGSAASSLLAAFSKRVGRPAPAGSPQAVDEGEALLWRWREDANSLLIKLS